MYEIDLSGKRALVFGVANERSIAWGIAEMLHRAGAELAFSYQDERLKGRVSKLADTLGGALLVQCDVSDDQQIASLFGEIEAQSASLDLLVHSVAYAARDDLGGDFSKTGREGFHTAMDISAYSLLPPGPPCGATNGKEGRRQHIDDDLPGI